MDSRDTLSQLNSIFQDIFDDETLEIDPEMTADDIPDWDSLTHIRLIAAIEKAFHVRFAMSEIGDMKSIRSILDKISG